MAEPMILRANALTTLDRLKSFLCIPADEEDSERDAALTQLINAASAWLETKLGRKLGRQTYDEPHFGTGTQRLVLNQYPIISIQHIRDNRTGAEIAGYDFVRKGRSGSSTARMAGPTTATSAACPTTMWRRGVT